MADVTDVPADVLALAFQGLDVQSLLCAEVGSGSSHKAVVAHKLDTWYQTMAGLDGTDSGGQVEVRETPEAS